MKKKKEPQQQEAAMSGKSKKEVSTKPASSNQQLSNEHLSADSSKGEIVLYQPDETISLEVRMEDETVWLTQQQMADLFNATKQNISLHINNIYKEGELEEFPTVKEYLTVRQEGKRTIRRYVKFYNLDVIISVGYRVKSIRGTRFRQWANKVLKDYIIHGYAINQHIRSLEQRMDSKFIDYDKQLYDIKNKVDFFVKSSLPPQQGIFFEGQVFDAYRFASDLIRKATHSIVLIDNYVDDSVLAILDKRQKGVSATIYTQKISQQLQLDIDKHNAQYPAIKVEPFNKAHDCFLLIDDEVFHIGASIKDLGKKWFAFTCLNDIKAGELMQKIQ